MIVKQRFKILRFITFLQSFIPPWKFRCAKILSLLPPLGTVYPFTPHRRSLVVLIWVDRKVKEFYGLTQNIILKRVWHESDEKKNRWSISIIVCGFILRIVSNSMYLWRFLIIVFATKIVFVSIDRIPLIKMIQPVMGKSYYLQRDSKTETHRNTHDL